MKKLSLCFMSAIVLLSSTTTFAQQSNWINSLRDLELSHQAGGGFAMNMAPADQYVLEKIRYEDLTSDSGMPTSLPLKDGISHNGYTTGEYLESILTSVGEFSNGRFGFSVPMGSGLEELYNSAQDWVNESGQNVVELFPRIMLNRCVDFFQLMLPVAGRNTAEVRRYFANFWVNCYLNSITYANNMVAVTNNEHLPDLPDKVRKYVEAYQKFSPTLKVAYRSMASFGYEQAMFFYKNTAGRLSYEAQAVGLVRLLGYLGNDFTSDYRRRSEPAITKTLTDVQNIQRSRTYATLIRALESEQSFSPNLQLRVRELRFKVFKLLETLPARVAQVDQ